MKLLLAFLLPIFLHQEIKCQTSHRPANPINSSSLDTAYLTSLIPMLKAKWPDNKIINLIFHGHSVPAGYFKTPAIHTFESYPLLVLKKITDSFPTASINSIRTAIGGENAEQGAQRFDSTVLTHAPDVLFIDYALNDRRIGIDRSKKAWEQMIEKALEKNIKVVLLTPTPDLHEDISDENSPLEKFSEMIIALAEKYHVGLVDSYSIFKKLAANGTDLKSLMAQPNHINKAGHQLVADAIYKLFGIK